jgi:hypothetical protein
MTADDKGQVTINGVASLGTASDGDAAESAPSCFLVSNQENTRGRAGQWQLKEPMGSRTKNEYLKEQQRSDEFLTM